MLIRIGYDIVIDSPDPVPMILMLYVHPSRIENLKQPEKLIFEPEISVEEYIDNFGNRCGRITAPEGKLRMYKDMIFKDSGEPDIIKPEAQQLEVSQLPPETLEYLLASRYCEVDALSNIAWELFGETPPGWARVQAVCDWVHNNITYGYEHTFFGKTAYQVYTSRSGVCRDFAHLALTFCRCLNIPARYATGFLGDIGVPPSSTAMDFHGWFEVFLDGNWYTFDARHNIPRVGRVLMGIGRDATDVALMTSFGEYELSEFKVWAEEITSPPEALNTKPAAA